MDFLRALRPHGHRAARGQGAQRGHGGARCRPTRRCRRSTWARRDDAPTAARRTSRRLPMLELESTSTSATAAPRCCSACRSRCPTDGVGRVMGRNGVGKTTLLNAAMGLLPRGGRGAVRRRGHHQAARRTSGCARGHGLRAAGPAVVPAADHRGEPAGRRRRPRAAAQAPIDEALDLFPRAARPAEPPGRPAVRRPAPAARHRPRAGHPPQLLLLDEPTEGIQPSIILEIEEPIVALTAPRRTVVLLVEQYVGFALRPPSATTCSRPAGSPPPARAAAAPRLGGRRPRRDGHLEEETVPPAS